MANKIRGFVALTGGTLGCLDTLTSASVANGDMAYGVVDSVQYTYVFDASSTAAANPPLVIQPISGTGRWLLSPAHTVAAPENILINGNLDIWQRATSKEHTGGSNGSYGSVDRWRLGSVQDSVGWHPLLVERSDVVPAGSTYSMLLTTTNANDNRIICQQHIESRETKKLKGKTVTFSVKWLRSGTLAAGSTIAAYISYATAPDNFATATVEVSKTLRTGLETSSTSVWATYSYTFAITDNMAANGLAIQVVIKTSDFGPLMSTAGAIGRLAQAELREGSLAIPTRKRSYSEELALCQRYYDITIANTRGKVDASGEQIETPVVWHQPMRATPTVTLVAGTRSNVSDCKIEGTTVLGARHWLMAGAAGGMYALMETVKADAEL